MYLEFMPAPLAALPGMWGLSAEVSKGQFAYALPDLPKYLEEGHSGLYDQADGLVPALDKFQAQHKTPEEKRKLEAWWRELSHHHNQTNTPYDASHLRSLFHLPC